MVIHPSGPYALEVRAFQTGARLGVLVVGPTTNGDPPYVITCMSVTPALLVVGLSNGTVIPFAWTTISRAFGLSDSQGDIETTNNNNNNINTEKKDKQLPYCDVGPYRIPGPALVGVPLLLLRSNSDNDDKGYEKAEEKRDTEHLARDSIMFLSTPTQAKNDDVDLDGAFDVVYALLQKRHPTDQNTNDRKKSKSNKGTCMQWDLVRMVLSNVNGKHGNDDHKDEIDIKMNVKTKKRCNGDLDDGLVPGLTTTRLDTLPYHDPKPQQQLNHHHHHQLQQRQSKQLAKAEAERQGDIVDLHVRVVSATEHLITIARPHSLHIYRVLTTNGANIMTTKKPTVTSTTLGTESVFPITCVAMNAQDDAVAVGLANGEIKLWPNFVAPMQQYLQAKSHKNISKSQSSPDATPPALIARTLHWHAHPVQTLAFHGHSTLYSGGVEAVLVQWEYASHRGTMKQRPAAVLPRLAVGALTSSSLSSSGRILITAADATLQMYECHNHARIWHVQLWPGSSTPSTKSIYKSKTENRHNHRPQEQQHSMQILTDPYHDEDNDSNNATVLVTGVPGGRLLWYNTTQQQVTRTLQAVALNSVSRTEPTDEPWPPALVTHAAAAGSTLVTIDTQPTENLQQGRPSCTHGGGSNHRSAYNMLESLKFWKLSHHGSETATCMALMPSPHGAPHKTTALAVTLSGSMCCTVSNDDKSFRIWRLGSSRIGGRHHSVGDDSGGDDNHTINKKESTTWRCAYRVAWPAGLSKQKVRAVTFSSDGSIVALAFRESITLWSTEQGSFLTSLHHLEGSPIESLSFCCKGRLVDTIISYSQRGVVMQSPFPQFGASRNIGWTWELPSRYSLGFLSHMLMVDAKNTIVVAWFHLDTAHTTFLLVDSAEGTILHEMVLAQASQVTAMAVASSESPEDISFYAMTANGDLFLLSTAADKASNQMVLTPATPLLHKNQVGHAPKVTPLMSAHTGNNPVGKRTALVLTSMTATTDNQISTGNNINKRMKVATKLGNVDEEGGETRLGRLRGSVTRGFLGRHLQRK